MIIDSHVHLPSRKNGRTLDYSKRDLIQQLDVWRIDYAVVIPDNIPKSTIGDLDEVLSLVEKEKRLFVMGTIDIKKNAASQIQKLDLLFQMQKIVAVKIFPGHDPIYPTDRRLTPVYDLCVKYDRPIVIHTGGNRRSKYNDPKFIVKIANQHPNIKIVISHYFFPRMRYCYELTKPYENIYFDTSALADDEVVRLTGLEKIREILTLTAKERPNNVLFGTDYGACSIQKHIALIESLALSKEAQHKLFAENAIQLFRLRL